MKCTKWSPALRTLIVDDKKNNLQLVPLHEHFTNPEEKSIDRFMCHFIAGLSDLEPKSPLQLWFRLVKQCEATIYMLHPYQQNPHLSTYKHTEGFFNYNTTLMAPPGIKKLVYKTPKQQKRGLNMD